MNIRTILASYPKYHKWAEDLKEHGALQASSIFSLGRSKGRYSDRTACAAVRLADNGDFLRRVAECGRFVDSLRNPNERAVLVGVWRGNGWRLIAQGLGLSVLEVVAIWQQMMNRAESRFAGAACVPVGGAYAQCPNVCRPARQVKPSS